MSQAQPIIPPVEGTFCINHPQTPTSLRCNRCGNPICVKCARCERRSAIAARRASKSQQAVFYTATQSDYIVACRRHAATGGARPIHRPMLGFFALFAGPIVGGLIAEVVWRATGRRRGQYTWIVVAACMILRPCRWLAGCRSCPMLDLGSPADRAGLAAGLSRLAVGSAIARLRYGKIDRHAH